MYLFDSHIPSNVPPIDDCGFEGPEKRLEVFFELSPEHPEGLRSLSEAEWQSILDLVKCQIIGRSSNSMVTSYVLSESSLFVYPSKLMLKTCGTTTLLNCLDKLSEDVEMKCGARLESITFSRKNYNFPHKQPFHHRSFETEVRLLESKFNFGSAHILGPVLGGGDHHVFYSYGLRNRSAAPVIEILMSELDQEKMKQFFRTPRFIDAKTTTRECGLADVLPNMRTEEVMFEPCGYSVNAINDLDGSYFTVHVTPEAHCSFVSFETNYEFETEERRTRLIKDVLRIFRPGRFSVVVTGSNRSDVESACEINLDGFSCKFRTQYEFEGNFFAKMVNHVTTWGGARRAKSQSQPTLSFAAINATSPFNPREATLSSSMEDLAILSSA
jgi:S-adenosylmethionine decarboxylase